jgi:hypothetical protein
VTFTRRPNSSSGRLNSWAVGFAAGLASPSSSRSGPTAGGPMMAPALGSRHGSCAASVSHGSTPPPFSSAGGRCSNSWLPAGLPNADASDSGAGGAVRSSPNVGPCVDCGENAPFTPVGLPKVAAALGSTAGRCNGRGASRGRSSLPGTALPFDGGPGSEFHWLLIVAQPAG